MATEHNQQFENRSGPAAQARAFKSEVLLILHKLTRHDNTDPPDKPQNFFLQGLQ